MLHMDNVRLICADCKASLDGIKSDSIQCIVTSPPYNKGVALKNPPKSLKVYTWKKYVNNLCSIDYSNYGDNLPQEEYEYGMVDLFSSMYRIAKEGGSLFINHKTILKDKTAQFPKWIFDIRDWNFYQFLIWNRKAVVNVRKEVFFPTTEYIFWFTKGKKPKTHKDRCEFKSEVWDIYPDKNMPHPAPFPVKLPLNCINMTTDPGDIVLDPFCGICSTGVAAKQAGCGFIGFDLCQKYLDIGAKRIEEIQISS